MSISITAASNANPVVFTCALGVTTGQQVYLSGFTGNWAPCNGAWSAVYSASGFSIPIDSTNFGALAGSPVASIALIQPNPLIDLTTVTLVQDYLRIKSDIENDLIQTCITAASVEWIWRTGRGPEGYVPTNSPFVSPVFYDEFYDGNGSVRQFIRNWPIVSVQALLVNGQSISAASGWGSVGWMIDQSKKSLVILSGVPQRTLGRAPWGSGFTEGVQNVEVQYTAGFSRVPQDVVEKCTKMVAVNYRRTKWLDLASETMGSQGVTGTTSYRAWEIPPDVAKVISNYSRDLWV
jgi:hypothetical protein